MAAPGRRDARWPRRGGVGHGHHAQGGEWPRRHGTREGTRRRDRRGPAHGRGHRALLRPERGHPAHGPDRPQEPGRGLPAGGGGARAVPAGRARGPGGGRRDPALDAGRLHRHARLRRVGQPHVARGHRLRPDRGRRGGDDGELRPPPARDGCRVRGRRPGRPPSPRPRAPVRRARHRGGAAHPVRRAHHHCGLHPRLHARGPRRQDVPADGHHHLLGALRRAAALAHRRAGGLVVPAQARRRAPRGRLVRAAEGPLHPRPAPGDGPSRRRHRHRAGLRRRGPRLRAVPRHRVHAEAGRGLHPHRDAQGPVGGARGVGGHLHPRGEDRQRSSPK